MFSGRLGAFRRSHVSLLPVHHTAVSFASRDLHRKRFPNCPVITATPYGVAEEAVGSLKRVPTSSGKTMSRKTSTRKGAATEATPEPVTGLQPDSVEPAVATTSKRGRSALVPIVEPSDLTYLGSKTRATVARPTEVIEEVVEMEIEPEPEPPAAVPKKGKGKKSVAPKKATRMKKEEPVEEVDVDEVDSGTPRPTDDEQEVQPTKKRQSRAAARDLSVSQANPRLGRSRSTSVQRPVAHTKPPSRTTSKAVNKAELDELALPPPPKEKKTAGRSRKTATAPPRPPTPEYEEDVPMEEPVEEEPAPQPATKVKSKSKAAKPKPKKPTEVLSTSVTSARTTRASAIPASDPPEDLRDPPSDPPAPTKTRAPPKPKAKPKKETSTMPKAIPVQIASESEDAAATETDPESVGSAHESQELSEIDEPQDQQNMTPKVSVRRSEVKSKSSLRASDASTTPRQAIRDIVKPVTEFTQEELQMTLEQYVHAQMQRESTKLRADGEKVINEFVAEAAQTRKRLAEFLNG